MNRYEDQPAEILFRDLFDLGRKTPWTADDRIEYDEDVAAIKIAVIREASVGVGDTEAYREMVAKYAYWKGRYELAVRGMADEAAIEIMGKEP